MNQLLNQYCLTYASTAKQADLTTLLIGTKKVNDFDTCLQHLCRSCLLLKCWSFSMNWHMLYFCGGSNLINWFTQYIKHTPQSLLANWNGNSRSSCFCVHSPNQSVCRTHGNTSHCIITQMLGNLNHQFFSLFERNIDGFIDLRETAFGKFNIQNGPDNLSDFTYIFSWHTFTPYNC